MKEEPLRAVIDRATNTQAAVLRVMAEIYTTDRTVFDDIVRVAMTPGAKFEEGSRTIDFLSGHTVLGQNMYDEGTGRLRSGFTELVTGCVENSSGKAWELVQPEQQRIVIDDEFADPVVQP